MQSIAKIAAMMVTGERLKLHHTSPSKNREIASKAYLAQKIVAMVRRADPMISEEITGAIHVPPAAKNNARRSE